MKHVKYFLSEYEIHENNTTWYSVYEFENNNLVKFVGDVNITHRYFMKGQPFLTRCIPYDNDKLLVGVNNKECINCDTIFEETPNILNDLKNIVYRISNNDTIKSYGSSNEEIHCF